MLRRNTKHEVNSEFGKPGGVISYLLIIMAHASRVVRSSVRVVVAYL